MALESFTVSVDDASAVPVSPTSSVAVERRADGDNELDGLHFTRFTIAPRHSIILATAEILFHWR
jgi:hypothetical protein